jgi:choline-sulfatase
MPPQWRQADWPSHPAIDRFRRFFDFHPQFTQAEIRRLLASYYATCAYLDRQIGRVLGHLEKLRLLEDTVVVYTSDHGEGLGARGIYGKFSLYDESAAVPMVLAGPGVPSGQICRTPVSLIDTFPTAVETVGARLADSDVDLPGRSLLKIAAEPDADRPVFSEYHAVGSLRASYMVRNLRHKYNHYVGGPPQLFDMLKDPDELHDLSSDPAHALLLREAEGRLRAIVDPEAADALARADQRKKVDAFGGEAAVLARGAFDNSPVPGEEPAFRRH